MTKFDDGGRTRSGCSLAALAALGVILGAGGSGR